MSDWDIIIESYNNAVKCLWGLKGQTDWRIDRENGIYFMLNAYRLAQQSEEKNHLFYARILAMMADEMCETMSEYAILTRYIEPSLMEYELAQNNGQNPSEKEIEKVKLKHKAITYKFGMESSTAEGYKRALRLIDNHELLEKFGFHDSKPISFTHDEDTAVLKLEYHGNVAAFEFIGVIDIEVSCDPRYDWVFDFYCYRKFEYYKNDNDFSYLIFDIGLYKITCKSITVIGIEYKKSDSK